ncbi:MAG: glycoside hydrolase family 57 protein [Nitrospirota bacterium]
MTDSPLYVSILWHMHQPYYKDPFTGIYRLPWVRLHGIKDYLDMVEVLSDFPEIKQTFNLTPSLLEQIIDYADNGAVDRFLELTVKKASELNLEERKFLIENFFLANWDNMIKPFRRYNELLVKRGAHLVKSEMDRIVQYFSSSDFLDLQVLFNLCWIDPLHRKRDSFLSALVDKGRDFTEDEKKVLVSKQVEILKQIIPAYAETARRGQIEICVSPYYHPILPLLCDTDIAKISMPGVHIPRKRFSYPVDAQIQIRNSLQYCEKIFHFRPRGMWPSEGAVSEEAIMIASQEGVKWMGTDEDILSLSIGKQIRDSSRNILEPNILYRPYSFENISIIFRDHILSDLIGFVYQSWDSKKAAEDLVNRLLRIHGAVSKDRPHLVSIILDGENAWEYYANDGYDFLRHLYGGLSREKRLKTVTVSEFLEKYDTGEGLKKIHPGSWINANFSIWIGHEEDNLAWDYLSETRQELESFQKKYPERDLSDAWKAVYISEGSDWNWWYGDEHVTETQKDFDELFRSNLMTAYKAMGKDIPHHLYVPVLREDRSVLPSVAVRGFIDPRIDGIVTSYYEWYQGAFMDIKKYGGSMHRSESILASLYYGFNKDILFLRLDPAIPFDKWEEGIYFLIEITKASALKCKIKISAKPSLKAELFKEERDGEEKIKELSEVAIKDILEIGIPFMDLEVKEKDEVYLSISIRKDSEELERCPWRGHIAITVPTPDFEALMWY